MADTASWQGVVSYMKEFFQILRRFVPPYKRYLVMTVSFNILSAVLNIFSFAAIIPILQIIFKTEKAAAAPQLMAWNWDNMKEVAANNMDYYVNALIADIGPTTTLLVLGLFLATMTFLKTGALSSPICGRLLLRPGRKSREWTFPPIG